MEKLDDMFENIMGHFGIETGSVITEDEYAEMEAIVDLV